MGVHAGQRSTAPAQISGLVYNDANANGRKDKAEKGLAGQTVFLDANNNGKLDAKEWKTVTDSAGRYTLSNLPAAAYHVRVALPAGWRMTYPASVVYDLVAAAGASLSNNNFCLTQLGMLSGTVFNDLNGNARADASEKGLANWRVFIDANNNGKCDAGETSVLTDSQGRYVFSSVPIGKSIVRVVVQAGYKTTTPKAAAYTLTVKSGQAIANLIFGQKR